MPPQPDGEVQGAQIDGASHQQSCYSGNISHLWKETCPLETWGSIVESDDGDVMDENNTGNKAARLGVKWSHYPDYSPWENLDSFFCSFYKQAIKNVEKAASLLRCLKWSVLKWDALDHDESFLYPAVVKMTSAANSCLYKGKLGFIVCFFRGRGGIKPSWWNSKAVKFQRSQKTSLLTFRHQSVTCLHYNLHFSLLGLTPVWRAAVLALECQGQTISLIKGLVKTWCTEFLCLLISLKVEKCIQMYFHICFSVIDGCNQAF